ncbi:hypothetical protein FGG08_004877 [Glutinoglossum americanum]|uniref:C3H1-type domain-containing protein n=1 Tax=Glutinoglossum americanum TaxID=1670608 RepID=A0A9P8L3G9_9PEZI|nr:hypothetical protein FGG08_004877 [Glutinoglossum americanum]
MLQKCTYGTRCKFSHDGPIRNTLNHSTARRGSNAGLNTTPSRPRGAPSKAVDDSEYRRWRYMIPRASHGRPLGADGLSRFFRVAFQMASAGDPSTIQQVITSLSSEGGLLRITELTEIALDDVPVASKLQRFEGVYLPFLRLVTHEDVLSSLVLEGHVGTIYTFLYGNHGRRAIQVFKSLAGVLFDLKFSELAGEIGQVSVSMCSTLAALAKVIELNQTACVNEGFQEIVETLTNCIGGRDEDTMGDIDMQAAYRSLDKIRARLGLGSLMPLGWESPAGPRSAKAAPVFELEHGMPGQLSPEGPRHDNDHEDISNIKILPTTKEIHSQRQEYLPVSDPQKLHHTGIGGLLDRHFRLLREDTVGQLRDAVGLVIERLRGSERGMSRAERREQGARVFIHEGVLLADFKFERKSGLHALVEFDQPQAVKRMKSPKQRAEFWSESKQLQVDSLLRLVDSDGGTIFLSVSERNDVYEANQSAHTNTHSLWDSCMRAAVTVQPVESEVEELVQRFGYQNRVRQVLVEFPGVLLPSFRPTLEALQQMSQHPEVPFSELLAPLDGSSYPALGDLPPPAYSLQHGFRFKLSSIVGGANLVLSPRQRFDIQALKLHSSLDDAQCTALVHGLTNSLALIQGPPGTGKSYVGVEMVKVLLANRKEAKLGPIICVCYTNHALDQILEHLIRDGVSQVIRLGSRSKSEILGPLNLITVSQKIERTSTEKKQNWDIQRQLDKDSDFAHELLQELGNPKRLTTVKTYLETNHIKHYYQLFGDDQDGWTTVHHKPENIIDDWLEGWEPAASPSQTRPRPIRELLNVPLFDMSAIERGNLYDHWIAEIKDELLEKLVTASRDYADTKKELNKCRNETNLRCLRQAHIIGVTTTGLARNLDMLRRLPSKVLLCEEAGEVMEAHILTALLPSIEHCILIGDHEQLRPQIQNFDLSCENPRGRQYSLNISLFERLIRPFQSGFQVPFSTLEIQRRMHPSIANLVRHTLYPKLKDHPSVREFPEVSGIRRRLFWLDHREKEAGADATQPNQVSHSNDYEVDMVSALVSHLVRQGTYKSQEIAIITPYLLQLRKIRKRLSSAFEIVIGDRDLEDMEKEGLDESETNLNVGSTARKTTLLDALRVATVDNFQGEEANVTVVSLVRSNDRKNCGFLKTSNRINVLLR